MLERGRPGQEEPAWANAFLGFKKATEKGLVHVGLTLAMPPSAPGGALSQESARSPALTGGGSRQDGGSGGRGSRGLGFGQVSSSKTHVADGDEQGTR